MIRFDCSGARQAVKHTLAFVAALALGLSASIGGAATGAGALDPTFGVAGKKIVDLVPGPDDDIGFGAVQADGKLVVAGYVPRPGTSNGSLPVARFLDNGELDPAFGNGGVAVLAIDDHSYSRPKNAGSE